MNIVEHLPWLLSCITIYATILQGNKKKSGWWLALINQTLWLTWILASHTWGFLPLNLTLSALYIRNWIKWHNEKT